MYNLNHISEKTENGSFYGSAGIVNLTNKAYSQYSLIMFDDYKAHYSYEGHVNYPTTPSWFNTTGTYDHSTYSLSFWPSVSIGTDGPSGSNGLDIVGSTDTRSVDFGLRVEGAFLFEIIFSYRLEAIFMLVVLDNSHAVYQDFLISQFLNYYPDPFVISKKRWTILLQFFELDLSKTNTILDEVYSLRGPFTRIPSDMLRSYLLSVKLGFTLIADWIAALKECHLYAIVSGFMPDDVLGIFRDYSRSKTL